MIHQVVRADIFVDLGSSVNPAVDIGQPAVFDTPSKVSLKDDLLKDIVQANRVGPVGCRRKSKMQSWLEMVIDLSIRRRCRMLAFITDNDVMPQKGRYKVWG